MTNTETKRLLAFSYAKQHAFRPAIRIVNRREAKNQKNAIGQKFLKHGKIVHDVSLEKVFVNRK